MDHVSIFSPDFIIGPTFIAPATQNALKNMCVSPLPSHKLNFRSLFEFSMFWEKYKYGYFLRRSVVFVIPKNKRHDLSFILLFFQNSLKSKGANGLASQIFNTSYYWHKTSIMVGAYSFKVNLNRLNYTRTYIWTW